MINPRNSLTFRISLIIVLVVLVLEGLSGFLRFSVEKSRMENDRQVQEERDLSRLVSTLASPFWEYNVSRAQEILKREFQKPSIHGIFLMDDINNLFTGIERMDDGSLIVLETGTQWTPEMAKTTEAPQIRPMVHEDRPLGKLYYFNHRKDLDNTLFEVLMANIRDTLIVALVVILALRFVFQRYVVKPVEHLTKRVVEFGRKYFPSLGRVESKNEIQELDQTFSMMEESIQRHEDAITHQLYTERVTGLSNRTRLLLDIQQVRFPSLAIANLNDFKEINEFYGPEAGDQVLRDVSAFLKTVVVPGLSKLYKLAADEFAILFDREGLDEEYMTGELKHLFQAWSSTPFSIKGNNIFLGVTVGASLGRYTLTAPLTPRNELFVHADMALKKAKKSGKSFLIYHETMNIRQQLEDNLLWTRRLRDAIDDDRILVYQQPIVHTESRNVEKFECLIRMRDESGQIHSPFKFLPIAKRARMYPFLTRSVVQKAFDLFRDGAGEFSINLSIDDILDDETRALIVHHLKTDRGTAKRSVFELLESEGIENYSQVKDFIAEIKALGAKVAIDDFGSGYSNFEHILRLDVDYIKIDASLIKTIDKERHAQVVVRTIISFAKELNLKTIAEFVHSKEVYEMVKLMGVDYCQGYFFGEPMPGI